MAAHIKRRAACTLDEKKDTGAIVMPMCSLGCDDLYERGYVAVKDGRVALLGKKPTTPALADYVSAIEGNKCTHWRTGTMPYFQWHYETHSSSA